MGYEEKLQGKTQSSFSDLEFNPRQRKRGKEKEREEGNLRGFNF